MIYTHAAAALIAGALAFAGAWKTQDWRYGAREAQRLQQLVDADRRRDKSSYDAATKFEKERTRVETVFETITETVEIIVDRPVYRNVCFDDDGLRALRSAVEATAAQSGGAVPSTE